MVTPVSPCVRTLPLPGELDLVRTLAPLRRAAPVDLTLRLRPAEAWRATRTPVGPGVERIAHLGSRVEVAAWGPGAEWLLDQAPALLGLDDQPEAFRPRHPLLATLARRFRGLRLGRTSAVLEALVPSVFEQKVPGMEARLALGRLVAFLGEPAPAPPGAPRLRLPPAPERLTATPYEVFHRMGVERRRAETVRRAASYARRLEETVDMAPEAAAARLCALPGIGPWTASEVAQVALGDRDSVSLGDYHLPHLVAYVLAGEPRGTDARMLELLEPFRGQRARVIRLLLAGGVSAPRRGPRLPLNRALGFG